MEEMDRYDFILDYLSGNKQIDKEVFAKIIGEDKDLHQTLQALDRMSRKSASPDQQRMWDNIRKELKLRQQRRRVKRWSVAAAIFIPLLVGGALFLNNPEQRRQTEPLDIVRNDRQIQLLLADGHVMQIQEKTKDSIVEINGTTIRVGATQMIAQADVDQTGEAEEKYNVLQVPRSCEYMLVLPDGSRVWLNSDTELRFPSRFSAHERRIFLKGEAYFEVAEDKARPFRVESHEMTVEALGTSFNVNSYRDNGFLVATLVEGSVKVTNCHLGKEAYLMPGEQARIQNGEIKVVCVEIGPVLAWKEGRFEFSNMTLAEIACQLERWYDVHISFSDPLLRDYPFTGVIKRYNKLQDILALIEETTKVNFQVSGYKIIIDKVK